MARIEIGMTFPSAHADSISLWRVEKPRGKDTWECVITDESADYAGTRRVFGGEEIRNAIANQEMWEGVANEHDVWWNERKIGETVHYHAGFGTFVRGVIEADAEGKKMMRPTALVGAWKDYDLPRIDAAGNLRESYYAKRIREGTTMQPNFSNMVEAVGVHKGVDPRGQPALDLTMPAPTTEQTEAARLTNLQNAVLALLSEILPDSARPYSKILRERLIEARKLLIETEI